MEEEGDYVSHSPKRIKTMEEQYENFKSFIPRDYQIEILEEAKQKNVIACLGTGTGKTFIAVMLVKELSYQIRGDYNQGSKRTVFLVPTVPLVQQQTKVLEVHTDLSVNGYHGGLGVDLWSKAKWEAEFSKNHVLVMVAEVFRNVLDHGFSSLDRINLIVFDECHRAVKNHPYREIMRLFDVCPPEHYPRVLGLTASVLNGKCAPGKLETRISELEKTLRSCTLVSKNVISIQEFGTKPKDRLLLYREPEDTDYLRGPIARISEVLLGVQKVIDESIVEHDPEDVQIYDPIRDSKKYISEVIDILQNMGMWCGIEAIQKYLEQLEKAILREIDDDNLRKLRTIKSALNNSSVRLKELVSKMSERQTILESVPDKLKQLLKLLKQSSPEYPNSYSEPLCGIVFVQKRITAFMLWLWLDKVSSFKGYEFLKVNFVVGHGSVATTSDDLRNVSMVNKKQDKVLIDFRKKVCNLLVASSVIEEGMDVPQCNLVIRFDPPTDFRSYVQSKGRARAKVSSFVLMFPKEPEEGHTYVQDLTDYRAIEKILLNICQDREIPDEDAIEDHMADVLKEPYMPDRRCGAPRITMSSAIGLVNRYCCRLPGDAFTRPAPIWKINTLHQEGSTDPEYQCTIRMPINSVIKEWIVGDKMISKQLAKMAAALDVCKILHLKGELDENFLPVRHTVISSDDEDEEMDCTDGKPGTKQKKKHYPKKIAPALSGQINPITQKFYLYRIEIKLLDFKPSKEEFSPFLRFDPAKFDQCFGILTSQELPLICDFNIFNKTGKLMVNLIPINDSLAIYSTQQKEIERFQGHMFTELLELQSSLMVYDPATAGFSYYVVPLRKVSNPSNWNLDFLFMQKISNLREKLLLDKSTQAKKPPFVESDYIDSVLKPVYQLDNPHPCYVYKIRTDLNPKSKFFKDTYDSYEHYFMDKYQLKVANKKQPLVEVYYTDKAPLAVPNYLDRFGNVRSLNNRSDKTILLVAELCERLALPGSMRRSAILLPLILHRINSLLQVEQLRHTVSLVTGIGKQLPSAKCEPMLFDWQVEMSDVDKAHEESKQFKFGELVADNNNLPLASAKIARKKIKLDSDLWKNHRPALKTLLTSITSLNADDFLNLERLETVGDAFLKYATSMYCFHKHPDFDEGRLTSHKMKQISNNNLCKLGIRKGIPEIMLYTKFEPVNWRPPGFKLPDGFADVLVDSGLSSYHLMLPGKAEDIRILSPEELRQLVLTNQGRMKRVLDGEEAPADYVTDFSARSKTMQQIADKNIADCVEALIGSYVISTGTHGALLFMSWIGLKVLPLKQEDETLMQTSDLAPFELKYSPIPQPPSPLLIDTLEKRVEMERLWHGFESLEKTVGYTFKDKSYLLQAFTHSSYVGYMVTDCYQRLEFLGDAVLDYVITRQLYADPKNFDPGELSDLRQALVNNIFFGMLAVKYNLHKHIKYASPGLLKLIGDFAQKVHESETKDLLKEIIIEEVNCQGAEEVEVPKVLGDVVESLAGAIFLDSGMSFDTVWKIFGKLMHHELAHYRLNIPKNPVRQLMEMFPSAVEFLPPQITVSGKVNVTVIVQKKLKFCGFGTNKKSAKSTSAKRALKHFLGDK